MCLVVSAPIEAQRNVGSDQSPRHPDFLEDAKPESGGQSVLYPPLQLEVVPTFECAGVYCDYRGDIDGDSTSLLEYREMPGGSWLVGHAMWADRSPRTEFRGSVVGLAPDTEYEFRVTLDDPDGVIGSTVLYGRTRTWDENPPIGLVVNYPAGVFESDDESPSLVSGTAHGWTLIEGSATGETVFHESKITADPQWKADLGYGVDNHSYIIFRNIVFTGGRDAVVVNQSHHIRFEDCEFREFGIDPSNPTNPDPTRVARGIRGYGTSCSQVVVQDSLFHSPNGSANSWGPNWDDHPNGPHAVLFDTTDGNHVVRRCQVIGDDTHWWSDGLGGHPNRSHRGGFYRDSDVYDNLVTHVSDDAIELDGGQMNVRVFRNRILRSKAAFSTAPCVLGPCYIYRNIAYMYGDSWPLSQGGPMIGEFIKAGGSGGDWGIGRGALYVYNNTSFQPTDSRVWPHNGKGMWAAIVGIGFGYSEGGRQFIHTTIRNNILIADRWSIVDAYFFDPPASNRYDFDLAIQEWPLNLGGMPYQEPNGIWEPDWDSLFVDWSLGDFTLAPGSAAIDRGEIIINFSDGWLGSAPDVGAIESY